MPTNTIQYKGDGIYYNGLKVGGDSGFKNVSNMVYSGDYLQSFDADGQSYTCTWSGGALQSITDGATTWTITYNGEGKVTSMSET